MPWTLDRERTWAKLSAADQGSGGSPWLPQVEVTPVCTLWRDALVLRLRFANLNGTDAAALDSATQQALRLPWEVFAFSYTVNTVTATEVDVCEFLSQNTTFGDAVRADALALTPAAFAAKYVHTTFTKDGTTFPLVGLHAALYGVDTTTEPHGLNDATSHPQRCQLRVHAFTAFYSEPNVAAVPVLVVPAAPEADVLNGSAFAAAMTAPATAANGDRFDRTWDGQWYLTCDATADADAFSASADQWATLLAAAGSATGLLFDYPMQWFPDHYAAAQQISFHLVVQYTLGNLLRFERNVRYDFPLRAHHQRRLSDIRPRHLDWSLYTTRVNGLTATDCWSTRDAVRNWPTVDPRPTAWGATYKSQLPIWIDKVTRLTTQLEDTLRLVQDRYFQHTVRTADWPEWEAEWEADREWLQSAGPQLSKRDSDVLDRQTVLQQLNTLRLRLLNNLPVYRDRGMLTAEEVVSINQLINEATWSELATEGAAFVTSSLPQHVNAYKEQQRTGTSARLAATNDQTARTLRQYDQHAKLGVWPSALAGSAAVLATIVGVATGFWAPPHPESPAE